MFKTQHTIVDETSHLHKLKHVRNIWEIYFHEMASAGSKDINYHHKRFLSNQDNLRENSS